MNRSRVCLSPSMERSFPRRGLAPHLLIHLLSAELQARLLWLGPGPVRTLSA